MRAINIANAKNRDAQVGMEMKAIRTAVRLYSSDGLPVKNIRMLKFTPDTDVETLIGKYGLDLTNQICNGDVEIDIERVGLFLKSTKKIFLDKDLSVAHRITRQKVMYSPNGEEKGAIPFKPTESNINTTVPLRWTGKMIPKAKAVRMFAFIRKYQIRHINGLTFDFLQAIARQLYESDSLMLVGAGVKGISPVVMSTGGTPYRAFLEGRIKDDRYCLLLHLTNLELKSII